MERRRLRPIAPKPMPPPPPPMTGSALWRQARKRGREDHLLLPPVPKTREIIREATSSYPYHPSAAGDGAAAMVPEGLLTSCGERLRRLSLMGSAAAPSPWAPSSSSDGGRRVFPTERDLISKLQVPRVIKPRPARPLWTTVCIDSSIIGAGGGGAAAAVSKKTAREVELELELPGALPAIVSGHHNRVYLANEAYKVMVGQPVCPWLDSVPGAGASRRINGVVVLDVRTFGPATCLTDAGSGGDAFPCTARISWEHDGDVIASLTVPCGVEHLTGKSGDYHFIWRFDSSRASIIYCIA